MNLFQFAIVFKGDDDRDAKILHPPTTQLAADVNQVMLLAARLIPEEFLVDLDLVQIAVRPFLKEAVYEEAIKQPASKLERTRSVAQKKTLTPERNYVGGMTTTTSSGPVWTTNGATINWLEPTVSNTVYASASSLV